MKFFLILILIFLSLGVRLFVFEFFIVSNSEMLPTLFKNDFVGVWKYPYSKKISRGDVVLIQTPNQNLAIRRVMGLPQDRIFYSNDILYINEKSHRPRPPEGLFKKEKSFLKPVDFEGQTRSEMSSEDVQKEIEHWQEDLEETSYSILLKKKTSLDFGPYKVPNHRYFVMGDHRMASRDSRTWAVQNKEVKGEVIFSKKKDSSQALFIPQGTQIRVREDPYFPLFFETLDDVLLENKEMKVRVESQDLGLRGNISKGKKWIVSQKFQDVLSVRNDQNFSGGQDKSVIPLDSIKGKVVVVLWGCEKHVEFLNFLCHFNSFRKGRWFWPVHKESK